MDDITAARQTAVRRMCVSTGTENLRLLLQNSSCKQFTINLLYYFLESQYPAVAVEEKVQWFFQDHYSINMGYAGLKI